MTTRNGTSFDLATLGWDADWQLALRRLRRSAGLLPARVVDPDKAGGRMLTAGGLVRATYGGGMLAAAAADPSAWPCAGDWTALRQWPGGCATIELTLPSRTAVRVALPGEPSRRLAANVDLVIVAAPSAVADVPERVARLLSRVAPLPVPVVIALTGAERAAAKPDPRLRDAAAAAAPDADIEAVVTIGGSVASAAPLTERLESGRCAALLGLPGAGRSALIDALAGATVLATPRRSRSGARHAEERCRGLVPLPGGGSVIDTRQLRAVGRHDEPHRVTTLSRLDPARRAGR